MIEIEGLSQEEAYFKIVALSESKKGQIVHVDTISDGRKISLKMTGRKFRYDFTVHAEYGTRWVSYYHDFLLDMIEKRKVQPDIIPPLMETLEDSVLLIPITEIYEEFPKLATSKTNHLSGHTIDYLLRMIRWLGLQEDVNYWGPQYEGECILFEPLMIILRKEQN